MTVVLPGYSIAHRPAGALPEHWLIRAHRGACTPGAIVKAAGGGQDTPMPPLEPLGAYADRLQAPVVVNASGWWGDAGVEADLMGAQITDGAIVKDWLPHSLQSWIGTRCVAVMRDGTLRTYTLNTPAADMLADGVWHTFSQGALALVDGNPTNFAGSLTYAKPTARTLLGDDADGDLHLIVVPGKTNTDYGATGQQILDLAAPLNLRTLVLLDGGGSTQLAVDGRTVVPSSDLLTAQGERSTLPARAIPQVLAFHAPRVGPFPVVWRTLSERGDGWSGGVVRVAVGDRVEVALSGVQWAGPGPVKVGQPDGKATVCTLPEDIPRPPIGWPNLAYLNSRLGEAQNSRVGTGGTIDCSASAPGAVAVTFSYPA